MTIEQFIEHFVAVAEYDNFEGIRILCFKRAEIDNI